LRELARVLRMSAHSPGVLMLNAQIEVLTPLDRNQTRVHECFGVAVWSTRGEPHP
jgi:hypothetical protein